MQIITIKSRLFVFLSLLILSFMQISAVAHANEHLLNTSETRCITHLEAEQFSNLLTANTLELNHKQQVDKPKIQKKRLTSNCILISYLSRAPPRY